MLPGKSATLPATNTADRVNVNGRSVSPYSFVNPLTSAAALAVNAVNRFQIQGYTFNIANGASVQNLQLPGDIAELLGVAGSWDDTTFAGFNNVFTLTINNENKFNAVNVAVLNVNRFLPGGYYMPVNQVVSPTSIVTVSFNNGTGATLTNFNLLLFYR